MTRSGGMNMDPDLRALLVCPSCRGDLMDAVDGLLCEPCDQFYPVQEGVPFLVPECARPSRSGDRPVVPE